MYVLENIKQKKGWHCATKPLKKLTMALNVLFCKNVGYCCCPSHDLSGYPPSLWMLNLVNLIQAEIIQRPGVAAQAHGVINVHHHDAPILANLRAVIQAAVVLEAARTLVALAAQLAHMASAVPTIVAAASGVAGVAVIVVVFVQVASFYILHGY
jgi:hypothetical protein